MTARRSTDGARLVVQAWLGTRLVMAMVAVWVMIKDGRTLEQVLGNWDVAHFLSIAAVGYADQADIAFFPGWPLLLRLASGVGVSTLLIGTLIALVASGFAAAALYRMAGTATAIAWLLAPTAVFTMVPYTESVFCAAAFWAWERATARHWGQAAALAALAAGVRVSGVFLIGALAILAVTQAGSWLARGRRLGWLVLPSMVVAAYGVYLFGLTGSWSAWYETQAAGWSRGFTMPWVSLQHTLEAIVPGAYAEHPEWVWVFRAELISMAVGLVVTIICLVKRRWAESFWVGIQVLAFSVSYWFMSVNRAVLLWFPLWMLIGRAAEGRGRRSGLRGVVITVAVVVSVAIQAVWAWLFFTSRWAS